MNSYGKLVGFTDYLITKDIDLNNTMGEFFYKEVHSQHSFYKEVHSELSPYKEVHS